MSFRRLLSISVAAPILISSASALADAEVKVTIAGLSAKRTVTADPSTTTLDVPTLDGVPVITVTVDDKVTTSCNLSNNKFSAKAGDYELSCQSQPSGAISVAWKKPLASGQREERTMLLNPTKIAVDLSKKSCNNPNGALGRYEQESDLKAPIYTCYRDAGALLVGSAKAKVEFKQDAPGAASVLGQPATLKLSGVDWTADTEALPTNLPVQDTYYYPMPVGALPAERIKVLVSSLNGDAKVTERMCFDLPRGWPEEQFLDSDFSISTKLTKTFELSASGDKANITWRRTSDETKRTYCAAGMASKLDPMYLELKDVLSQRNVHSLSFVGEFRLSYKKQPIATYLVQDETVQKVKEGTLLFRDKVVDCIVADRPLNKWTDELCIVPEKPVTGDTLRVDANRLSLVQKTMKPVMTFEENVITFRRRSGIEIGGQPTKEAFCAAFTSETGTGPSGFKIKSVAESVKEDIYVAWDGSTVGTPIEYKRGYLILPQNLLAEAYVSAGVFSSIRGTGRAPASAYWLRGNAPLIGYAGTIPGVVRGSVDLGAAPGLLGAGTEDGTIAGVSMSLYGAVCVRVETSLNPGACITLSGDAMALNTSDGLRGALQGSYGFFVNGSLK